MSAKTDWLCVAVIVLFLLAACDGGIAPDPVPDTDVAQNE